MFSNRPESRSWNQGIWDVSATRKEVLGALRITKDGRKFRYARAGAAALTVGLMGQAAASVAHHIECSCAATSAGADTITVTLGATAVTANQYRDGYLNVNKGTGIGYCYYIESHPAADASATVEIRLGDRVRVDLAASGTSEVSLLYNPFDLVTVSTTQTLLPVGLANVPVPINYYYWAQTGGAAAWLVDDTTPGIGSYLIMSDDTAGQAEIRVTALEIDHPALGILYGHTGVEDEPARVWLLID